MRIIPMASVFLLCGGLGGVVGQDWNAGDLATRRLEPAAFVEVPVAIRTALARRGCTIPQPHGATQPTNIISGHFTSPNRTDWAALCSRNRVSVILVFRGGLPNDVAELARQEDRGYLQGIGDGRVGFSRGLAVADPSYIREHHNPRTGPPLPLLDHEGINDIFIEKASVVWFWSRNRWIQMAGAD
jgi:hypothetical protein